MKLELFELTFSGKHFQTLEKETSKFEGQILKRLPLLHQCDTTNLTYIYSEFCAPMKMKRKRHMLVLKELITQNYLSAD